MTELVFREEREEDIEATLEMRGRTRENPAGRAHGLYRGFGWRPTGELQHGGDEILALD